MVGGCRRIELCSHPITDMVAREFTLKALQKALSAASIRTAENLSAHGQPIYTLNGKVVTAASAPPVQAAKVRATSPQSISVKS